MLTFTRMQCSMLIKETRRCAQVTILFIIPFGESSGKGIEKERKRKENIIKFVWIRRCRRAMNPTTFQTVEAAKRKIQEKRRAGVQGQNPPPQKKAKKKRRAKECGFPTRICTVLSGCAHPRPRRRRKWSPDHKNKNRLEGKREEEEEARWIFLSSSERKTKNGPFFPARHK